MNQEDKITHAGNVCAVYNAMAEVVTGMRLRCTRCGTRRSLYMDEGWPTCCMETMLLEKKERA